MINLSRKALLALEAVLDVAIHARPDPVQAREITARQGVPQRYLEQVMQALVRANILRGVRGPRGGYRLARERRRISVRDIIAVINDLEEQENEPISHSDLGKSVIQPLCARLHTAIEKEIGDLTIADLCDDAQRRGQDMSPVQNSDFTI